jgi:hypothetical protein
MQKNRLDIEKLYDTYAKKLYFTSLRITADSFDAEEAMQEAFIRLYKLGNGDKIEKIESWLTSVCIRKLSIPSTASEYTLYDASNAICAKPDTFVFKVSSSALSKTNAFAS